MEALSFVCDRMKEQTIEERSMWRNCEAREEEENKFWIEMSKRASMYARKLGIECNRQAITRIAEKFMEQEGGNGLNPVIMMEYGLDNMTVLQAACGIFVEVKTEVRSFRRRNYPSCEKFAKQMEEVIEEAISKNELIDLDDERCQELRPKVWSPLAVVPKKNGKIRIVVDMTASGVNRSIDVFGLSLPSMEDVVSNLFEGATLVKIDLASAYHSVRVPRELWQLMLIEAEVSGVKRNFVQTVMPFGLSASPAIFQAMSTAHAIRLREFLRASLGHRARRTQVIVYLDDFLIVTEREIAQEALDLAVSWLRKIGWGISEDKVVLGSKIVYLGWTFDTVNAQISIDEEKRLKYVEDIVKVLSLEGGTPDWFVNLRRLVGKLSFVCSSLPAGRNRLRAMYKTLALWEKRKAWQSQWSIAEHDLCWFEALLRDNTTEWRRKLWKRDGGWFELWRGTGSMRWSTEMLVIATDASSKGFGAWIRSDVMYGEWQDDVACEGHISAKELTTVLLAVRKWKEEVRGKRVLLLTDNAAVVATITKGSSGSPVMNRIRWDLWREEISLGCEIEAFYVNSRVNVLADHLSRGLIESIHEVSYKFLLEFEVCSEKLKEILRAEATQVWLNEWDGKDMERYVVLKAHISREVQEFKKAIEKWGDRRVSQVFVLIPRNIPGLEWRLVEKKVTNECIDLGRGFEFILWPLMTVEGCLRVKAARKDVFCKGLWGIIPWNTLCRCFRKSSY